MYKRVLIPLDGSAFAEQVLPQLARFLSPDKTQLALLGVIDPRTYTNTVYEYTPVPALNERKEEYISYLETIRTQLQHQGFRVYCTLVTGDPAEQILNAAEQDQVDLIAMTTHGRSGIRRWALGSVAERVIHHATLPVFLVRDEVYQEKGVVQRILVALDGSTLADNVLTIKGRAKRRARQRSPTIVCARCGPANTCAPSPCR